MADIAIVSSGIALLLAGSITFGALLGRVFGLDVVWVFLFGLTIPLVGTWFLMRNSQRIIDTWSAHVHFAPEGTRWQSLAFLLTFGAMGLAAMSPAPEAVSASLAEIRSTALIITGVVVLFAVLKSWWDKRGR